MKHLFPLLVAFGGASYNERDVALEFSSYRDYGQVPYRPTSLSQDRKAKRDSFRVLTAVEAVVERILWGLPDSAVGNADLDPRRLHQALLIFFELFAESPGSPEELEAAIHEHLSAYFTAYGVNPETVGAIVIALSELIAATPDDNGYLRYSKLIYD